MTISAQPVRLDFDDYVKYTEKHPEGSFELIHGAIYELAPEGDPHLLTRHGIYNLLIARLDFNGIRLAIETNELLELAQP